MTALAGRRSEHVSETNVRSKKPGRSKLKVLVIRHAIAADPKAFSKTGKGDALRPLTPLGRKKMRRAARGIVRLVPRLDALATSPLTRAIETGEIVAERYDHGHPIRLPALAPGKSAGQVMDWLKEQAEHAGKGSDTTVAIVGHEPSLGQLVSWMLTGLRESFIPFKKGGACLVEFDGEVKPALAKLLWAMKPSQLRELAG
jgi:phosphohistidine phosphatase